MTELFRDQQAAILFDIPNATAIKAEFYRDNELVATVNGSPATVPYKLMGVDGSFKLLWHYTVTSDPLETYTRAEEYSVVTPVFKIDDLQGYNAKFAGITEDEYRRYELICRKTIEGFTGQRFGYYSGPLTVYGGGSGMLRLPYRAVSVTGLSSNFGTPALDYLPRFLTSGDGFYLRVAPEGYLTDSIKVPAYEEAVYNAGLIGFPSNRVHTFNYGTAYRVYGDFGWATVPEDIKEAGLILAEMYSCKDASWRDRYLKTIRSSEWTFTYDDRAYRGTGSALADSLLEPYTVPTMAVI